MHLAVLGWQKTCESADDISATLAAISTELDIGVLYRGIDKGNKHRLISVVYLNEPQLDSNSIKNLVLHFNKEATMLSLLFGSVVTSPNLSCN